MLKLKAVLLCGLLTGCSSSQELATVKVADSGQLIGRAKQELTPVSDYKFMLITTKGNYYGLQNLDVPLHENVRVEIKSDGAKFLCAKNKCAKFKYMTLNNS